MLGCDFMAFYVWNFPQLPGGFGPWLWHGVFVGLLDANYYTLQCQCSTHYCYNLSIQHHYSQYAFTYIGKVIS